MTTDNLLNKIKSAKKIAIFGHRNPDPDAYGSMFAMRELCRQLGVFADIFAYKNKDGYLDYIFPLTELKTNFISQEYDLVIMLDLHLISRLAPELIDEVSKSENIIVIDHHHIAEDDCIPTENFIIKSDYAAACEILTEIFVEAGIDITPDTATYLYAGLMGDTDRFLHNNLSKHVFETALLLYEKNARVQKIYDYMYRFKTREQIKLNKLLLSIMTYVAEGRACYAIFTIDQMNKIHADQEDVKAYTNEMVKIKDVDVSFLCIDYGDHFKISMRSNNDLNTLIVANRMGGGGHIQASAFEIVATPEELAVLIPKWAEEILNA